MNQINFSENIIKLRHKRKITQEQLADFIGVTKASVSKWENKQSMPDIMLLPRLAAFFDVTVDELLGYEPQLSKEQIQRIYQELAHDFATLPFEEVMDKSRDYVKRYYSCYMFLEQICVLWMNHYTIPQDVEEQQHILREILDVCEHIIANCNVVGVCNDVMSIKAMVELFMGKASEVIETLEPVMDPTRLSGQNDMLLIQAYQMIGDMGKARSYTQITLYMYLMGMIGSSTQYMNINMADIQVCKETIKRIEALIKAYDVDELHPNITAQFYYQSAVVYITHGMQKEALKMLNLYVNIVKKMLEETELELHGDSYFDDLDEWIAKLDLKGSAPRNKKLVVESFFQTLEHPLFEPIKNTDEFEKIMKSIGKLQN